MLILEYNGINAGKNVISVIWQLIFFFGFPNWKGIKYERLRLNFQETLQGIN